MSTNVSSITNGAQAAAEEVISSRFVPNDLTKGLVGLSVAMIAIGYAAVKFSAQSQSMLQEAQAMIADDFNAALELAKGASS